VGQSVRFVHCGGFRFGSRSWEGPESWQEMRNQDLWQTFRAVLSLCRSEKVNFLFLTGNLFEQESVSKETVRRVAKSLETLAGIKVFITPGESDPLVEATIYRLAVWPENVHIFPGGDLSHFELPELNTTIYGSAWTTYRQEKSFPEGFSAAENPAQIKIMLLHAEAESANNSEGFVPIRPGQIAASGLTYLALGHKTLFSGIQRFGKTYCADSGTPEARGFKENGPHGVLLGITDGSSTQIQFVELGKRRYVEKTLQLTDAGLKNTVAQILRETTAQQRKNDLFRFRLIGIDRDHPDIQEAAHSLQEMLAPKFSYMEILPETHPDAPLDIPKHTPNPTEAFLSLKQVFLLQVQKRISAAKQIEEQQHWELVQKIGLTALHQGRGGKETEQSSDKILSEFFFSPALAPTANELKAKTAFTIQLSKENSIYRLSREVVYRDTQPKWLSEPRLEDQEGNPVLLPEKITPSEYLLETDPGNFRPDGLMLWREEKNISYYRRLSNLRQTGSENLSPSKVRASLVGAMAKIMEQAGDIAALKAEYDSLKQDWEKLNQRLEQERLLQIEQKNKEISRNILIEKISALEKIEQRLNVLQKNPDYRQLREMQAELARLEEVCRKADSALAATQYSQADWAMVENLREECAQWARLENQSELLKKEISRLTHDAEKLCNSLSLSGYASLADNVEEKARQAEEALAAARTELLTFSALRQQILDTEADLAKAKEALQKFALFARADETEESRFIQAVQRLDKWQNSKIGVFLDRGLKSRLGLNTVKEKLAARVSAYCQKFGVRDYAEFMRLREEFLARQKVAEDLELSLSRLRKEARREQELQRIIKSHSDMLKGLYSRVGVACFSDWLDGWQEYRKNKNRLAQIEETLQQKTESAQEKAQQLAACAAQLREKLQDSLTADADLEQALEAVTQIARQLRIKDEAEKSLAELSQVYEKKLDKRDMQALASVLEPLADLEREALIPREERLANLEASRQELAAINQALAKPSPERKIHSQMARLEKQMETLKQQWQSYNNLKLALADTMQLLDISLEDWQVNFKPELEDSAGQILNRLFSLQLTDKKECLLAEAKRYYFAYRLALSQLAVTGSPQIPLLFVYSQRNALPDFRQKIKTRLQELLREKKIILGENLGDGVLFKEWV